MAGGSSAGTSRRQGLEHWREIEFREIEAEQGLTGGMSVEVLELLEAIGRLIEGRVLSYDEVRSPPRAVGCCQSLSAAGSSPGMCLGRKLRIWPGLFHLCRTITSAAGAGEGSSLSKLTVPCAEDLAALPCLARSLGEIRMPGAVLRQPSGISQGQRSLSWP